MYETDAHNQTLIVGGWMGNLWANNDDYLITDCNDNVLHEGLTGSEGLALYNELNGTKLDASFFDVWLKHYREMSKNPLTGTRVGKDHPAYHQVSTQTQNVREWMKANPQEVERIRENASRAR